MPRVPNTSRAAAASPASTTAATAPAPETAGRMVELRVSANLMTLEAGLYCLFQQPGVALPPRDGSGLPGVRVTLPPNTINSDAVSIRGLHADGWLGPADGAALVHVRPAMAQILVTVYQSPTHAANTAPRLKVVRLEPEPVVAARAQAVAQQPAPASANTTAPAAKGDVVAHVQRAGDVGVAFGDWVGTRGSKLWVEGFGLAARPGFAAEDIEYQAVLGRGWLSPWISAGKFCGSRGMALPLLGFNIRLRGKAAEQLECVYAASFTDGTEVGPIPAGRTCEAASLAPLESFRIELKPRRAAAKKPVAHKAPVPTKPAAPKRRR